jgi:hypothetical protein
VLSSAFILVSANKNFVRGALYILLFSMGASAAAPVVNPCAAHEDPLQEAIAALANEVLSFRNLQGPMRLEWRNESSIPANEASALEIQFSERITAARKLLTDDAAAPSLRVTLHDTPTQIVAVARIPTSDGEEIRLVEAARATVSTRQASQAAPTLQKRLLWKQREPVLDAVEHAVGDSKILLLLGRDTVWAYNNSESQFELRGVAHIPGSARFSRSSFGRILFPKLEPAHFLVEVSGKICSGAFVEKLSLDCTAAPLSRRSPPLAAPSAKLVGPCDYGAWTLSSDDGDWSRPDRLFLRDVRNPLSEPAAVLDTPGPVLSLSSAQDFTSSIGAILNLNSGEYEVYRFSLACHN